MTTGEDFSITVLAIEDDPACREVISEALSRECFKVLSARPGTPILTRNSPSRIGVPGLAGRTA